MKITKHKDPCWDTDHQMHRAGLKMFKIQPLLHSSQDSTQRFFKWHSWLTGCARHISRGWIATAKRFLVVTGQVVPWDQFFFFSGVLIWDPLRFKFNQTVDNGSGFARPFIIARLCPAMPMTSGRPYLQILCFSNLPYVKTHTITTVNTHTHTSRH